MMRGFYGQCKRELKLAMNSSNNVSRGLFRILSNMMGLFTKIVNVLYLLKVQSPELYNNKYMIASTQLTNTEISTFIAVLVFKSLSDKVKKWAALKEKSKFHA